MNLNSQYTEIYTSLAAIKSTTVFHFTPQPFSRSLGQQKLRQALQVIKKTPPRRHKGMKW